jgi:putative ABC transport system permease protein
MGFCKDVRFAFRQHRKSLGFTLVVLATLGLCIGANSAIFSVLDAVLFRAAPYPEPDRLAMLVTTARYQGEEDTNPAQTGALFEAVREGTPGLDTAAYVGVKPVNFTFGDRPEYIQQQRVSSGFFGVLGVPPQFGREFTRLEDIPGGPAVAVLSHPFWQRVFHGNLAAIGSAIRLQGIPYTVVGVMPRSFRSTVPADVWTPLRPSRTGEGSGTNYDVVARLRPGTSWPEVSGQLKALSRGLMVLPNFPREYRGEFEERIIPFQAGITESVRTQLLITWAAVLLVLMIGCVNIAGLLLARSASRQREIATRMALGAGRASIVRQLLVESLLLAIGGCIVGLGVGAFALDGLKRLGAASFQASFEIWRPIELDGRVMLAMFALSILTSVVFGLAPALHTSRVDIRSVLVEGGRGIASAGPRWSRNALVVGEVALSLVLLVSAGLLVKTLNYLYGLSPGFDTRNLMAAQATLATDASQQGRYSSRGNVEQLFTDSLRRIRGIPGVRSAAVALTLPYERPLNYGFRAPDSGDPDGHAAELVYLTPGYFETLRIPVQSGRAFRDTDTAESSRVVVVTQSFAAKYYRGQEALGRHLMIDRLPREIVGVVGDVQQHSGLGDFGPLSVDPTIYLPVSQTSDSFLRLIHTWFTPKWIIRVGGPAGNIQKQVQSAVAAVDPGLAISSFLTMDDLQGRYTTDQRYLAALFSALAGLAVLLAAIGLYGLVSQSISQRTHELGLRLALGATAQQTMKDVVKPGLVLAGIGIAAGFVLSRLAVRFLESLLFGVRSGDAVTFVATAAILLLVTLVASAAPALRILRLDPARTLRNE